MENSQGIKSIKMKSETVMLVLHQPAEPRENLIMSSDILESS